MKHVLATLALLGASLTAQTQNIVYHDDPNPALGATNQFPFGSAGVRTQQLIPQSVLGASPQLIQDLFVDAEIGTTGVTQVQVWYGDFEIRMGTTQLTTLTNDWATNLPNPTTVYRGPLLVRFVRDQWVPIGLPAPFLWYPLTAADNLVIDFICRNVTAVGAGGPPSGLFMPLRRSVNATISRAYALNWATTQSTTAVGVDGYGIKLGFLFNDGNFVTHDGRCAGSTGSVPAIGGTPGAWPQAGQSFVVSLADALPNSLAVLTLGLDGQSYGGAPIPLDLGLLGAPGCRFWHSPDLLLPAVLTDSTGAAPYTLVFPGSTPFGLRLFGTWLNLDLAANQFGLVPSGFATMIL